MYGLQARIQFRQTWLALEQHLGKHVRAFSLDGCLPLACRSSRQWDLTPVWFLVLPWETFGLHISVFSGCSIHVALSWSSCGPISINSYGTPTSTIVCKEIAVVREADACSPTGQFLQLCGVFGFQRNFWATLQTNI